MAKELQLRRGNTNTHNGFTGKDGEVTVDTETKQLVVHDNTTAGGKKVPIVPAGKDNQQFTMPTADGTAGKPLTTNGSGTLEFSAIPNTITLTTSDDDNGVISAGAAVFLNDDGTVSKAVQNVSNEITPALGSAANELVTGLTHDEVKLNMPVVLYIESKHKILVGYEGNKCKVGNLSADGTTITWGSEITVFTAVSYTHLTLPTIYSV